MYSDYCLYGKDSAQALSTAREVLNLPSILEDQVKHLSLCLILSSLQVWLQLKLQWPSALLKIQPSCPESSLAGLMQSEQTLRICQISVDTSLKLHEDAALWTVKDIHIYINIYI